MVSTKNMENYINDIPQFRKLVKYFGIEFELLIDLWYGTYVVIDYFPPF